MQMFDTGVLTYSSTLCTEEVITFINTQMLFWACSTNRPEGYRGKEHQCLWETLVSYWLATG